MSDVSWLRGRLIIAGIFGVVFAAMTFGLAMRIASSNGVFIGQQVATRSYILWMERAVNDYRAENRAFPPDLQAVLPEETKGPPLADGWKRVLLYSTPDNQLLIESLGRDGVRGGVGLDADLSNMNLRPSNRALPLGQQLEQPLARTFVLATLVCGAVAAVLLFPTLGRIPINAQTWPWLALQLVFTLFLAALMAVVGATLIAVVHIPSGH